MGRRTKKQRVLTQTLDREPAEQRALRPWLAGGVAMLFVARPLVPSEEVRWLADGQIFVMLWLVLGVLWLGSALRTGFVGRRLGRTDALVGLLVLLNVVSSLIAAGQGAPRPNINMLWQWIGYGLSFLLVRQVIITAREARALVVCMISLGVALACYGIYQYLVFLPELRAEYAVNPDAALRDAGLDAPIGSGVRQTFEARLYSTEPFATFALANSLAGYLAPWSVVAVCIAVCGAAANLRIRTAAAALCCAGPMLVCLALTQSRSAITAVAVGTLALVACAGARKGLLNRQTLAVAGIAGAAAAVAFLSMRLHERLFASAVRSLQFRIEYWSATWRMVIDHWLWGVGPGSFKDYYPAYKLPQASEEISDPHNFLLEVWATAGSLAALVLVVLLGWFFWQQARAQQDAPALAEEADGVDAVPHILFGAAAGFGFAAIARLTAGFSWQAGEAAVGLILSLITAWLWSGWIRNGELPQRTAAIGVAVLLVNLLASGGVSFPGVAGSLWLLLAIGSLWRVSSLGVPVRRWIAALGLAALIGLTAAFYVTGYRPVLAQQAAMDQATSDEAQKDLQMRLDWLHRAAAADPLAPQPHAELAALYLQLWLESPSAEVRDRFQRSLDAAIRLQPRSHLRWMQAGKNQLAIFEETGQTDDAAIAEHAMRQAVELYPTSATLWAELALLREKVGNGPAAREAADEAIRLDQTTPHTDKKLPPSLREQLISRGLMHQVP